MDLLSNKVAVITGASSGIGRAAARLFASEGARVVVCARRSGPLDELAAEIRSEGGEVAVVAGDVAHERTHRACIEVAEKTFGAVHVAFNNAGVVGEMRPLSELTRDEWEHVLHTNLTAAFLGAKVQVPALLRHGGGSLVFTGSFVGNSVGLPGMAAYGAAKAGLLGLVKGLTADYGAQGIRANALLPGGTETAMAGDAAQRDWAASLHAMKRIAHPDEIARAALFLASDQSSFVTGSALWADGGNSAVKL
ncbi:SDR family oxidoreductase [Afifella marina]|uniref:NAD(P)-dependent dehydrogenase, short-chain alcohol dehydrogenase family n=1 Tax=Afifella marina DSM 2698 TaxID=1120955 RepID=A0A1G5MSZ9_AFIMA|nr:SDR family oxidoreductase [Afifella marina]MBK1621942.1 short-chain dehydrogenase [Afifella marina DSM 2698]MBK1627735.1 short-chain dehydrogenase [Afifella marina]MBK5916702.1 short-chain dehydrogenase [Afifella marina]RAI19965.1 short-chain dehydrogenase [Afifella marina DSM 2698]SCZ28397.1 NAD(P)-dependent dehydrogenase, short-chain alcohol dehydrogenase family [Afifella marina DSM 2698]